MTSLGNDTDTNFTADYSLEPIPKHRGYDWIFLFVILFIFAGGLGNILVCLAVALDRKLQNVTNYFLFSLAIADLLVSLFVMPMGAIPAFLVLAVATLYVLSTVSNSCRCRAALSTAPAAIANTASVIRIAILIAPTSAP